MNKKLLLGGAALLIVIAVIVGIGVYSAVARNNANKPLVDVGEAFMVALRDRHYDQAFALCNTDFQVNLRQNPPGLQSIETNQGVPVKWSLDSVTIPDATTAQVSGAVTFINGRTGISTINLGYADNVWKVTLYSYHFDAQ